MDPNARLAMSRNCYIPSGTYKYPGKSKKYGEILNVSCNESQCFITFASSNKCCQGCGFSASASLSDVLVGMASKAPIRFIEDPNKFNVPTDYLYVMDVSFTGNTAVASNFKLYNPMFSRVNPYCAPNLDLVGNKRMRKVSY